MLFFVVIVKCYILSNAYADIFTYINNSHVVCITNNLDSVPKEFRSSVKVTKEEVSPEQQKLLPEVQQRTTDPPPANHQLQPLCDQRSENHHVAPENRVKYINTALVFAGIVGSYFLLSHLAGSLGFPRIGMIAFLLLVLTGGVYLYNLYLQEMSSAFRNLRKYALGMKKNVEARKNKTEQMLKKLPEAE